MIPPNPKLCSQYCAIPAHYRFDSFHHIAIFPSLVSVRNKRMMETRLGIDNDHDSVSLRRNPAPWRRRFICY